MYDLEEKEESAVVRFISATHSALQNQMSAASLPPSTAIDGVWRRSRHERREHRVVCLSTSKAVPKLETTPCVSPVDLWWTAIHNKASLVEGECRITLPVSSRVLSNHRNCP